MPVLALDAGTTSTRAMLFGDDGAVLASARRPLTQYFPRDGWVEHDAVEIWDHTRACARDAIASAGMTSASVAAIGIAVQRETVVLWDRATGRPVHRAIVWQDRRTAAACDRLSADPAAGALVARTGLVLDPYFSATKLAWLLDHVDGARAAAARGDVLAGTIDSWLLWKLTNGAAHATDATNASRTLLFDIDRLGWDRELCDLFDVPAAILPAVRNSVDDDFGHTSSGLFGSPVRIAAMLGDQQAGAVGQDCLREGDAKATFGTGCFVLAHTGTAPRTSRHRLLATVALMVNGAATYALEGSIFNAGTVMQWLRDNLGIIGSVAETADIAADVEHSGGVYFVPAFTGLGAPWWDADARGAITGLTRDTRRAHIVRAALESVALQVRDLADAFSDDGVALRSLRVDGGMAGNDWLMQAVADQVRVPVERPRIVETTAWGAARLAGAAAGIYPALGEPMPERIDRGFTARGDASAADRLHRGWLDALRRARSAPASGTASFTGGRAPRSLRE